MLVIVERQGLIVLGYRMGHVDRIVGRGRESVRDCNGAELSRVDGVLYYVLVVLFDVNLEGEMMMM